MAKKKTVPTVAEKAKTIREEASIKAVGELTLGGVSRRLADTQVEIQKMLASVSNRLAQELQSLQHVQDALAVKNRELKDLYSIEVAAGTLDELRRQIEEERLKLTAQRDQLNLEYERDNEERERERTREQDDYEYNLKVSRRQEEEVFRQSLASRAQSLAEREKVVSEAEEELESLREQVADFDAILEETAEKKVLEALKQEGSRHELELRLLRNEMATNATLSQQKVASAQDANRVLHEENTRLRQELTQARADIKEIASSALESRRQVIASATPLRSYIQGEQLETEEVSQPLEPVRRRK